MRMFIEIALPCLASGIGYAINGGVGAAIGLTIYLIIRVFPKAADFIGDLFD